MIIFTLLLECTKILEQCFVLIAIVITEEVKDTQRYISIS